VNFDRREKKAFLAICAIGSAVACGIMAVIVPWGPDVVWVFVAVGATVGACLGFLAAKGITSKE